MRELNVGKIDVAGIGLSGNTRPHQEAGIHPEGF